MHNGYILITAAKNEELYIVATIQSVLKQSVWPVAWYVMDDGSTDRTAAIVAEYAMRHDFIKLHTASSAGGRNFGSQYKAIQAAYTLAKPTEFQFVGVHDADIAPESTDYYKSILGKFVENLRLGIAGGFIVERSGNAWETRKGNSKDSVAGGIQMFRRECFEAIGGYKPLFLGGSDWLAQIDARMHGWESVADPQLRVLHYRPTSSANGRYRGLFRLGQMDASFGSDPLFEIFKCAKRVSGAPTLIYNLVRLSGYFCWVFGRKGCSIPQPQAAFLRTEQRQRIKNLIGRSGNRASPSK